MAFLRSIAADVAVAVVDVHTAAEEVGAVVPIRGDQCRLLGSLTQTLLHS